ncbi:MAG: D-alanyl-D-alanine carboxypeptidase/D-alanyl-D-alanine-endopeptidase, partial [Pseudomonadota bacterium]|nr:D-alanyl-D-alanine carboxypeptidase/D-alanyl-D-alanine-endopeptidase [Pseudomonadota bacterium]
PNALLVNFDATRFYLTPSGQGVRLYFDPDMNLFQINNQVRLTSGPCKDFEDGIHIKVNQTGSRVKARLMGRYPAQCKERSLNYRLLGNTAYVGALFQSLWHELGGTFSGGVKRGRVEPGDTKLLDWKSRPLASMIRDMNKFSNNVMARILFLDLSDKTPATLEASRQVVEQILAESGLHFPELIIENGSGLSRRAQINVQHLGQLLNVAWHSPFMPEFVASLPVLGQDGTLRKRLRHGPVAGRAHIKTGTLDNSDAIAGYLDDAYQQNWIVVCIVENTPEMKAKRIEDTLLMWLYRH